MRPSNKSLGSCWVVVGQLRRLTITSSLIKEVRAELRTVRKTTTPGITNQTLSAPRSLHKKASSMLRSWRFFFQACGFPFNIEECNSEKWPGCLVSYSGAWPFKNRLFAFGQTVFQRKLVGLARACSLQLPYNYLWLLRRPLIKSLGSCRAPHNYPTTT